MVGSYRTKTSNKTPAARKNAQPKPIARSQLLGEVRKSFFMVVSDRTGTHHARRARSAPKVKEGGALRTIERLG